MGTTSTCPQPEPGSERRSDGIPGSVSQCHVLCLLCTTWGSRSRAKSNDTARRRQCHRTRRANPRLLLFGHPAKEGRIYSVCGNRAVREQQQQQQQADHESWTEATTLLQSPHPLIGKAYYPTGSSWCCLNWLQELCTKVSGAVGVRSSVPALAKVTVTVAATVTLMLQTVLLLVSEAAARGGCRSPCLSRRLVPDGSPSHARRSR